MKLQEVSFVGKGYYSPQMLKHLNRSVELDGKNIEARALLAGYYAQAPPPIAGGDPNEAREQIEILKTLDPERAAAMEALLPE